MQANCTTTYRMLTTLEVPRDASLLVHSSFKNFAKDGYLAHNILNSMLDYLKQGTLLLPTMSWRYVNANNTVFNEVSTPSNTGFLTELFRVEYATHRSLHPTHSVAGRGAKADSILGSHIKSRTPCDTHSPFMRLIQEDGWILLFGIGIDCCTIIHSAEEMIAPKTYVQNNSQNYTCIAKDGSSHTITTRPHKFLPRNYWQFQDKLAAQGRIKLFKFDNSNCLLIRAFDLYDLVVTCLKIKSDCIIATNGTRFRMM